jgi:sRNA-binding protein
MRTFQSSSLTPESAGRYDQAADHARTALQIHPGHIASLQQLARQQAQVDAKLKTLLDVRVEGEITQEEYAVKRREFHERQTAIRLQLEVSDRDDREIAEKAVKAFELSQTLKTRWETADPASKRTILETLCESVRLNQKKCCF